MSKKDSPNKFLGGIASIASVGQEQLRQLAQARQAVAASPTAPLAPTADISAGAAISGGAMDPINPFAGKTFKIEPASPMGMDASQTFQPPMASNEIGGAKDLFGDKTRGMAETIYGSATQRQVSVNSPYTMKSIPEGDKGAGLRALPDNVVENMGYDAATKMLSPLGQHHPQYFTGGREVTKQEFDSINKANKAKTWLGGGQGLIPDALTGGKPTRQYLNESTLFNPTTTKEKVADLNDTRMMNAHGGNSITGDTNNKMYKYFEEKKKKVRPNRIDRF
jgi:hypothetical protein